MARIARKKFCHVLRARRFSLVLFLFRFSFISGFVSGFVSVSGFIFVLVGSVGSVGLRMFLFPFDILPGCENTFWNSIRIILTYNHGETSYVW